MKYATKLTPLYNPANKPVRNATRSNNSVEVEALFDNFIGCCQQKGYSIRTREAYWGWIKRFMLFHQRRDPSTMREREVGEFLMHLEVQGHVTASTLNQAFSALQFLYRKVLHLHFDWKESPAIAKLQTQLPRDLATDEVNHVLAGLNGYLWLMASLVYVTGMQVPECVRLRVKDVSLARNEILVRDGKDELVRRLRIPQELHSALQEHMEKVVADHCEDMKSNWQGVYMSEKLQADYPNEGKLLAWQYVFAANRLPHDPCDNKIRRYHVNTREFQRALTNAALEAGLDLRVSRHWLGTGCRARLLFRGN